MAAKKMPAQSRKSAPAAAGRAMRDARDGDGQGRTAGTAKPRVIVKRAEGNLSAQGGIGAGKTVGGKLGPGLQHRFVGAGARVASRGK